MTWRLVRAFAWRFRWNWTMALPVALLVWLSTFPELARRPAFPPVSLAFISAALVFGVFLSRETRVLPLSGSELWRMTWWMAVAVPTVIFLLIRLLALDPEAAIVQAAHELVYLGIAVAGMPLLMAGGVPPRRSMRLTNRVSFVVMLGWFALPFVVPPPPTTFAAMQSWGLVLLGCGAFVAITPLFRPPPSIGNRRFGISTSQRQPPQRPALLDQLSGLSRLVPGQVGTALGVSAFVFGIELFPILFLGPPPSGGSSLDATGLLPFIPDRSNTEVLLKSGLPMYLAVSLPSGWTDWLRQLKFLPLGTWQLVAVISAGSALITTTFWLVLTTVHALTFSELPGDFRGGLFLFIVGLGTLLNSLWIRRKSLAFLLLAPVVLIAPRLSAVVDSAYGLPTIGLLLIIAALVLNYRTVTRAGSSSTTYRPISQMFGVAASQAPR